jgi:hypothetical protein
MKKQLVIAAAVMLADSGSPLQRQTGRPYEVAPGRTMPTIADVLLGVLQIHG